MKKKYNKIWRNTGKYNTCLPPNLPSEKIVTKDSKVCAMGSCFADEMGWWLRSNGVNVGDHGEVDELQHLYVLSTLNVRSHALFSLMLGIIVRRQFATC